MAHIDVRGPWSTYIHNNLAVELGDRHMRTAQTLFPGYGITSRNITVAQAEAVIEQITWEDNLTPSKKYGE